MYAVRSEPHDPHVVFLSSIVAYLLFFAAILYGIGFVGDLDIVPKGINDGPPTTITTAPAINISLLLLFAVQHNVMARALVQGLVDAIVPRPIERSTYVAAASLILMLLFWHGGRCRKGCGTSRM